MSYKQYTAVSDEQRQEKMEQIHKDLTIGFKSVLESDNWKQYLKTAAKFHRYSARNVMLITMQMPEATQVAAYNKWKELGRQVRKGEKGIQILAPIVKKLPDPDSGVPTSRIVGFRRAHVFDIGQTEGNPLPSPVTLLEGSAPQILTDNVIKMCQDDDWMVVEDELSPGINGETRWSSHTIVTATGLSEAQRAKTLVHELAHSMLHRGESDRGKAEVEAESVAYVVCQHFGLDTSDYTFGYIATWASSDLEVVKKTADTVIKTANKIVYYIESNLEAADEPAA